MMGCVVRRAKQGEGRGIRTTTLHASIIFLPTPLALTARPA